MVSKRRSQKRKLKANQVALEAVSILRVPIRRLQFFGKRSDGDVMVAGTSYYDLLVSGPGDAVRT